MIKRAGEKSIFKTKYFTIKDVNLQTSSSKKATYQIIERADATMIVPFDGKRLYLVREYYAAQDIYGLSFPKGMIDIGHDAIKTANKELQEEIGFKANKLESLAVLVMSPGYITQKTHVFLAQDLVESKLEGDELEELEVIQVSFDEMENLIQKGEINEARVIAAYYLAKKKLDYS